MLLNGKTRRLLHYEPHREKTGILLSKTKAQISFCFHYTDSTISLALKSEISSL